MKKQILYSLLVVLLLSVTIFQSCKKDEMNNPEVQTLSVTPLAPNKALLKGSIVNKGNKKVLDYGFVYSSQSDVSETSGTKISLGTDVPQGEFSKEADNMALNSQYNYPTLYVRAYLTDETGTAFGKLISVSMPSFSTSSIIPQSGKVGDKITISGNFYSASIDQVQVSFGNVKAKVLEASTTKIVAEVPSGISASHNSQISIQVTISGQTINSNYGFTILANFTGFSPKSGSIGTLITFTGDNLPSYYYYSNDIKLLFGQAEGSLTYSNSAQAYIPANITDQKFKISVVNNGKTVELPDEFTVTPPSITSVTPTSVLPGSYITVIGTDLPSPGGNYTPTITLGSYNVSITSAYTNQYNVATPTDIPAGEYTLTLKSGPYTITAPQKIKIVAPTVNSFSPSSGSPNTEVNIDGTFVAGQNYTVYFGSYSVYGTATSSTNLRTYVPTGLNAGKIKISVQFGSQTVAAKDDFTITSPSITSFTPTSGVPGTVITIYGTGLSTNYYYSNTVQFGTIPTSIISSGDNYIKVAVPSNTGLGAMKISVITNGQTVTSTDSFTVTDK